MALFNKKTVVDDEQLEEDDFTKPEDEIEGEEYEIIDGEPVKVQKEDLAEDTTKPKDTTDKDTLILELSKQVAAITEQITALKNPVKSVEPVKEPELKRPDKPLRPRKPLSFNLADQNDVASDTYKYFMEMDEYQSNLEEYRDAMDEYRDAKLERSQKLVEQSHQTVQKEREATAIKASMLSKLSAKGLTTEEALSAYDDALSGKLFDEEHIVALKMTERLNNNGKNGNDKKGTDFDKLKNKRERFGALPPVGSNGKTTEVLERDDFTKNKDISHLYRPKQK